jgi:hypothetical protein
MASKAEILAKKIFRSKNIKAIKNIGSGFEKRYKVAVFVPPDKTDELLNAMASAGAGVIGNYSLCSFRTRGTGTFLGSDDSNPSVGIKGEFQTAEEDRLEMICGKKNIEKVIDKLYEVHPYDEPAFDIYEVLSKRRKTDEDIISVTFKKKTSVKDLMKVINPEIVLSNIPAKLKRIKIGKSIIDCSGNEEIKRGNEKSKILYIKKNNNRIKAYLT